MKVDRFESISICKNGKKYEIYVYDVSKPAAKEETDGVDSSSNNNGEFQEAERESNQAELSTQLKSDRDWET